MFRFLATDDRFCWLKQQLLLGDFIGYLASKLRRMSWLRALPLADFLMFVADLF